MNNPFHFRLQLTSFMVLELVASALMLAIFIPLARESSLGLPRRLAPWR